MGFPFIENPETIEDDFYFLGGSFSTDDIYKMITDKMIDLVKNATGSGYQKKWGKHEFYEKDGFLIPFNFISKKAYRGVNYWMLKENDLFSVFENPYFLTFKQIKEKKGSLKKGSKGKPVVYFTLLYKYENQEKNIDFGTYDKKKMESFLKKIGITANNFDNYVRTLPIIKYYNVFNANDVEGIDFKLDEVTKGKVIKSDESKAHQRNEIAELIVKHYPKPQPPISHGGDEAYYSPGFDAIQMPKFNSFETPNDYYRTLLHEITHSTGSTKRLSRDFSGKFGTKKYANEELIAEFGAVFLSAQAGIIWHTNKNHAEYIKNWSRVLKIAKDDTRFLMRAASAAQKASDFVLNLNEDGEPEFYNELDRIINISNAQKEENNCSQRVKELEKENKELLNQIKETSKIVPSVIQVKPVVPIIKEPKRPKKQVEEPSLANPIRNTSDRNSLAAKRQEFKNRVVEFYNTDDKDISDFLGKVEIKKTESVVITAAGGQGSGKTTFAFRLINAFAKNYRVGHASIEEDPESNLYWDKADKYITQERLTNIEAPKINTTNDLHKLIIANDVIVIDSFAKMQEMEKGFEVDKDLRKKYNGKLFIVIFQQTSDGKMRGGTKSQFDADIVLLTEKFEDFSKNYVYADKNRYQNRSLNELHFNISQGKLTENMEVKNDIIETSTEYIDVVI
ncbi:zincin-like metallopeptidase domain-containing protein [Tenacibaculum maritimum]|uniref:zincin-like metallopeptidase domain-containing protein n=1 Tax=Tenacibaculum maritimum TaxID=107401 RepID=UPI003875D754